MPTKYTVERIFNECEFLGSLIWTESFGMKLKLFSPIFNKEVNFIIDSIPAQNLGSKIFLRLEKLVETFLEIDAGLSNAIMAEMWSNYQNICEYQQNPVNDGSENNKELNMEYFGIYTQSDLFNSTELISIVTKAVHYDENDDEIYFMMNFKGEWIQDGFLHIDVANGQIVNSILYQ